MHKQTDRWTDEQDQFYRTPSAKIEVRPYGKNQCKKKKYNQHSSVFKEFKNSDT